MAKSNITPGLVMTEYYPTLQHMRVKNTEYMRLVNIHYKALANTKYRVKITGGNKRFAYSNRSTIPIYGAGQGSKNSPIIWFFISDNIAQIMDTNAIGETYATDNS
jgi:hypothetical protein